MACKSSPCLAFDAYRAGFSDAARASDLGVRDYRLESFRDACFSLALETSNGSVAEAARLANQKSAAVAVVLVEIRLRGVVELFFFGNKRASGVKNGDGHAHVKTEAMVSHVPCCSM